MLCRCEERRRSSPTPDLVKASGASALGDIKLSPAIEQKNRAAQTARVRLMLDEVLELRFRGGVLGITMLEPHAQARQCCAAQRGNRHDSMCFGWLERNAP